MDAATAAKRKRPRASTDIAGEEPATTIDEVSDAEVEEFYAILRRMRDASRRLCGVADARVPARAPAWRPSFSWEDFAPAPPPAVPARPDDDERARQDDAPPARPGIDLNVEPEPDTPSSAPPPAPAPAPAAPRSSRALA